MSELKSVLERVAPEAAARPLMSDMIKGMTLREEFALMADDPRCVVNWPHVIVDIRVESFAFECEVYNVWPAKPEWFDLETNGCGLDWLLDGEFGPSYGGKDLSIMLQHELVPGDIIRLRAYEPIYTTDYWGESDVDYRVELIEIYRGIQNRRTREWLTRRALEEDLAYENRKRIHHKAMARFVRQKRKFWKICVEHRGFFSNEKSVSATLFFDWPKNCRTGFFRENIIREDVSGDDRNTALAALFTAMQAKFRIREDEFKKIPVVGPLL